MKNQRYWIIILFCVSAVFMYAEPKGEKFLAETYKSGAVRLVPELTIDDSSMPEDTFFESAYDVVCDSEGFVYVCDYRANNIKKFDSSGKFIKTIGRQGQGPGEFNGPYRIAVTDERMFVWEVRNRRLSALTKDGEFIKSVTFSIGEGRPQKIRSLPNGDIVIENERSFFGELDKPQECKIEVFSPDLKHKKTIYSHEVWRNKYISSPRLRNIPQPFAPLVSWDVSRDGKIICGYSEKYEIEIHDSDKGKISFFTHSYEPVKITEKDKKEFFSRMVSTRSVGNQIVERRKGADDIIIKNTAFSKYKPPYFHIVADSEGNILVFLHRQSRDEEYKNFDAFDSEGDFIGNVQIKGEEYFPAGAIIRNSSFWTQKTDEEGLIKIVKYRISD